jgi:hypothetical protein
MASPTIHLMTDMNGPAATMQRATCPNHELAPLVMTKEGSRHG